MRGTQINNVRQAQEIRSQITKSMVKVIQAPLFVTLRSRSSVQLSIPDRGLLHAARSVYQVQRATLCNTLVYSAILELVKYPVIIARKSAMPCCRCHCHCHCSLFSAAMVNIFPQRD